MNNHIVDGLLRESSETLWTSIDHYNISAMSFRIYNGLDSQTQITPRPGLKTCSMTILHWKMLLSPECRFRLRFSPICGVHKPTARGLDRTLSLNWHVQHLTWTQPPRTSGRCSFKRHVVDSTVACRQRIWDWIPAVISVWESGPSSSSVGESSHDKSLVGEYTIFSE